MKERSIPMRKCIGCMESKEKEKLIRIAYYEGEFTVDLNGRAKGRGAYICKDNPECLQTAIKRKSFERTFKTGIEGGKKEKLLKEITEASNDKQ